MSEFESKRDISFLKNNADIFADLDAQALKAESSLKEFNDNKGKLLEAKAALDVNPTPENKVRELVWLNYRIVNCFLRRS
jgi:hypothetical protein